MKTQNIRYHKYESGQSATFFALLIPFFVVAMIFAVDFGRFLVLQNQTRIFADGAATAAAGAFDVKLFTESDGRDILLNEDWSRIRADEVLSKGVELDKSLSGMSFSITGFSTRGNEVSVTVTGSCATMWSKPFKVNGYVTSVSSSARAATGISHEVR